MYNNIFPLLPTLTDNTILDAASDILMITFSLHTIFLEEGRKRKTLYHNISAPFTIPVISQGFGSFAQIAFSSSVFPFRGPGFHPQR